MNKRNPMTASSYVRCGEVYLMNFGDVPHEQNGMRPGVVFQNNVGNIHSPNIIALPLTTSLKKLNMPTHVLLNASETGLMYDSMVLAECPKCLPKSAIGQYITTLPKHLMRQVASAHLAATAAISFLDVASLLEAHEQAIRLNTVA